jgi:hypothetical protein
VVTYSTVTRPRNYDVRGLISGGIYLGENPAEDLLASLEEHFHGVSQSVSQLEAVPPLLKCLHNKLPATLLIMNEIMHNTSVPSSQKTPRLHYKGEPVNPFDI